MTSPWGSPKPDPGDIRSGRLLDMTHKLSREALDFALTVLPSTATSSETAGLVRDGLTGALNEFADFSAARMSTLGVPGGTALWASSIRMNFLANVVAMALAFDEGLDPHERAAVDSCREIFARLEARVAGRANKAKGERR